MVNLVVKFAMSQNIGPKIGDQLMYTPVCYLHNNFKIAYFWNLHKIQCVVKSTWVVHDIFMFCSYICCDMGSEVVVRDTLTKWKTVEAQDLIHTNTHTHTHILTWGIVKNCSVYLFIVILE